MMKFFRKYTKHLLAVFMALLLIVWLAGDPIMSWFSRRGPRDNPIRGFLDGREIRQKDANPVFQEIEVLKSQAFSGRFETRWQTIWTPVIMDLGVQDQNTFRQYLGALMQAGREPLNEDEWFLLVSQARRDGVFVPPEAVEQFKEEIGLTGPAMRALRQHFPLKLINEAIRSFLMVRRQAVAACQAPPISEADIRDFVRKTSERAEVTLVTLEASEESKFYDGTYAPTDAELAALFDEYKNVASRPYGLNFGYQQPEAVQIEYLRVTADALKNAQAITENVAYEYWERHQEEFTRPAASQPAPPASGPAPPPLMEKYPTFIEAKAAVTSKLQKTKADEAALRIAREIIDDLSKPWAAATATQPGGEKAAPQSETSPEVYAAALRKWSAKYPGVLAHVSLGMLEVPALRADPDIGKSVALVGGQRGLAFDRAAFLVEGLAEKPDAQSDEYRYFRKVYETCPFPFVDDRGNAYVFRTVAIRPKQPPGSLEAVRRQVVQDARLKRAYDLAGRKAAALQELAARVGLEAAFLADADLRKYVDEKALSRPTPFSRLTCIAGPGRPPFVMPSSVGALGSDAKLVDAVFDLASAATRPASAPATQPVRVLAWPQPDRRRWLVVQLDRILPPTQAAYDQQRPNALQYLRTQHQIKLLVQWFDADQIKARLKWRPAREERPAERAAASE